MPQVEVSHLTKSFQLRHGITRRYVTAVNDISCSIESGRTHAIVGESGAGKSTLARMIVRLTPATSGSVVFDGQPVLRLRGADLRRWRTGIGMVFQDPWGSLDPRMTIGQSVAEPLRVQLGIARSERGERAIATLDRVGIQRTMTGRLPHQLSGGQLQRVAIARALVAGARFVVCDEPVAALDASVRAQVLNLLADLQDERNLTLLFISHDLSIVRRFAHTVGVMRKGELIEDGAVAALFKEPQSEYTRELLSAVLEVKLGEHPEARVDSLA